MKWPIKSTSDSGEDWFSSVSVRSAQGTLPLLLRHIDMPKERISIITGDDGAAPRPRITA